MDPLWEIRIPSIAIWFMGSTFRTSVQLDNASCHSPLSHCANASSAFVLSALGRRTSDWEYAWIASIRLPWSRNTAPKL